jgi:hypothetical protein
MVRNVLMGISNVNMLPPDEWFFLLEVQQHHGGFRTTRQLRLVPLL